MIYKMGFRRKSYDLCYCIPFMLTVSCGFCDFSVGWETRGICCDTCNVWYHIDCQGMSSTMYGVYNRSLSKSSAWECIRCGMPNFSTSLFDTIASLEVSNRFETFSSLSESDSPVPDNIAPPPPPPPIKQHLRPLCSSLKKQNQRPTKRSKITLLECLQ